MDGNAPQLCGEVGWERTISTIALQMDTDTHQVLIGLFWLFGLNFGDSLQPIL
jgi:hypothetical protein